MRSLRFSALGFLLLTNTVLLCFLTSTNRVVSNDEARSVAAGVGCWQSDDFATANDFPPLARMTAVLPLLPLNPFYEPRTATEDPRDPDSGVIEGELKRAGQFAFINPAFNFYCLARMTGAFWWLIGAWVIFGWSSRLFGENSGYLGVILWSVMPAVLEQEQHATPWMPAAVCCLAATGTFRRYLTTPSWERAFLAGAWLGIALLAEFASLILLGIYSLLALIHVLTHEPASEAGGSRRSQWLQVASAAALSVWIVNLGYGLDGTGTSLERLDFRSRLFAGELPPGKNTGNRFHGSWLGRVILPLPAEYLKGIDRRISEAELKKRPLREPTDRSAEIGGESLSPLSGRISLGVWSMAAASFTLLALGRPGRTALAEELSLWIPALLFLGLSAVPSSLLPASVGPLLASPLLIIAASKLAGTLRPIRGKLAWLLLLLTVWGVGGSLFGSAGEFFTPVRTALFRQDLTRQGRKLGLRIPEPRLSSGIGEEERGLMYRSMVDSRGEEANYALFVPPSYRGDRPYPLILFLHGFGDRGTKASDRKFTEVGLPFTLKYRSIDFLVLCPRSESGNWDNGGDDARRAIEMLDAVRKSYRVDPDRIYLSGLSSGGTGVWNLAAAHPDQWAAIVPVAGSGEPSQASVVKNIPCWCFHNQYDFDIPVEKPKAMMKALRATGASPRYTEYLDTGHRAWERAYVLPELFDWLGGQRRRSRARE